MTKATPALHITDLGYFAHVVLERSRRSEATGETRQSLREQHGLMTYLFFLSIRAQKLVTPNIMEISGLDRNSVYRLTAQLEEKGFIGRTQKPTEAGSGVVWNFHFTPDFLAEIERTKALAGTLAAAE